jgi:NifU-like protein
MPGRIEAILRELCALKGPEKPLNPKKLTILQKIALIQEVIEREIRPGLQADGGDIELIDIEGDKVIIALRGMCTGCVMSDVTISGVQSKLKELVSDEIMVETDR